MTDKAYEKMLDGVVAWTEAQIQEGRRLQDIEDALDAKARDALDSRPDLVEALRAHLRGEGPEPKLDRTGEAYMWGAKRVGMVMATRNLKGRQLEKQGRLYDAMVLYELNVADGMQGSHPYDRLRIIYTHQKRYEDAAWVCQAYLSLPDREHGQAKDHFRHHLQRLQVKAARDGG